MARLPKMVKDIMEITPSHEKELKGALNQIFTDEDFRYFVKNKSQRIELIKLEGETIVTGDRNCYPSQQVLDLLIKQNFFDLEFKSPEAIIHFVERYPDILTRGVKIAMKESLPESKSVYYRSISSLAQLGHLIDLKEEYLLQAEIMDDLFKEFVKAQMKSRNKFADLMKNRNEFTQMMKNQ